MRIAFLPDYYFPYVGGVQVWTHKLSGRLARRGHEVTVITDRVSGTHDALSDGIFVRRVGWLPVNRPHAYSSLMLSRLTGLPKVLLRESFDVYLPGVASLLVARGLGVKPLVSVWHGLHGLRFALETKGLARGVMRTVTQLAAVQTEVAECIAVSETVRHDLCSANRRLTGLVEVVRGGIDVDLMSGLDFGEREFRVVFLGRLVTGKGVWDAIRAFLLARRILPGLKLQIVGHGPLRPEVVEFLRSLPVEDRLSISLLGKMGGQSRFRVLSEAMVLVSPSRYEAAPLTIVEALGCGTPVLAYDIPAMREIQGLVGGCVLVPLGSVSSLGEGLVRMLSHYEACSGEASASKGKVLRLFSWDRAAERLEDLLLDVA